MVKTVLTMQMIQAWEYCQFGQALMNPFQESIDSAQQQKEQEKF